MENANVEIDLISKIYGIVFLGNGNSKCCLQFN